MKTRNATQIVGFDELSLGGWDPTNGKRLWETYAKGRFRFQRANTRSHGEWARSYV